MHRHADVTHRGATMRANALEAAAERAVDAILDDLSERPGLEEVWENIPAALIDDLRENWREIVLEEMVDVLPVLARAARPTTG